MQCGDNNIKYEFSKYNLQDYISHIYNLDIIHQLLEVSQNF